MDSDEFVSRLRQLAPARKVLLDCDYGDDEADSLINSFICNPRPTTLAIESADDALLKLMKFWDLSHVEVGGLTFYDEPVPVENRLELGEVELDKLAYRLQAKDYVLLDGDHNDRVMCRVAPNGAALLDALIWIAGFYAKTAINEIDIYDEAAALDAKVEAMRALGGKEYESFCTTLLGI